MLSNLLSTLWIQNPIYAILLFLDGIVYSLVAYSYRLFMLLTQLNYSQIEQMISPIMSRFKAIIIVFVLFKVAVFLMQSLIDPEKLADGGKKLVVNIMISAGLLGITPLIFNLMNDLSTAILGAPETGAEYKVLPGSPSPDGLIARFVFGNTISDDIKDFGKYISASSLAIFLHTPEGSEYYVADILYNEIVKSDNAFDFTKITTLTDDIGRTVEYKYPILSTALGLFMLYSIVKIAIQIGIRMFKLVVLQLIAPIPIAYIIFEGVDGKFKQYYQLYLSTFMEAFFRVAVLFIVTGFIGQFFNLINEGNILDIPADGITKYLILAIVIFAGYSVVNVLPEFIGNIFGLKIDGEKGGFGKFMSGIAGVGIGAAAGIGAVGSTLKNGGGFGTALAAGGAGLMGGVSAGLKGSSIKDKIANVNKSKSDNLQMAQGWIDQGGVKNAAVSNMKKGLGITQRHELAAKQAEANNALLDKIQAARENAYKDVKDANGITYGTDRDEYVQKSLDNDNRYSSLKIAYESAIATGNASVARTALAQMNIMKSSYSSDWDSGTSALASNDAEVKELVSQYKKDKYTKGHHNTDTSIGGLDPSTASGIKSLKARNNKEVRIHKNQM